LCHQQAGQIGGSLTIGGFKMERPAVARLGPYLSSTAQLGAGPVIPAFGSFFLADGLSEFPECSLVLVLRE
jgi:hypothetical protein